MLSETLFIWQNPPILRLALILFSIIFIHGLQGHPKRTWTYAPRTVRRRSWRKSSVDLTTVPTQDPVFWPFELL
jgi:hypothetical protein